MSGRLTPGRRHLDQHLAGARPGTGRSTSTKFLRRRRAAARHCHHRGGDARHGAVLIDLGAPWVNNSRDGPRRAVPEQARRSAGRACKQDLDPISIDELNEQIASLKVEIARVEAHIQRVETRRSPPKSCSRSPEKKKTAIIHRKGRGRPLIDGGGAYDIVNHVHGLNLGGPRSHQFDAQFRSRA